MLLLGSTGEDVNSWQSSLVGKSLLLDSQVTGVFDAVTSDATKSFQKSVGLNADGVVGTFTLQVMNGDLPPKPDFPPLSQDDKDRIFEKFPYRPAPQLSNPEAITILSDWPSRNIVLVDLPQLAGVPGTGGTTKFPFHRLAAPQVVSLFQAWEQAGLIPLIKCWSGSWAPRFIRGSTSILSNHCYGAAFDLNAPQNPLGAKPAPRGKTGSVIDLVPLAVEHGFYWGGFWGYTGGRSDPMHFELTVLGAGEDIYSDEE